METCIFCPNELTDDTKPEHILLNALGGRKTTKRVDCSACNERFGRTIDNEVAQQVAVIRNTLQFDSGTGRRPPMLRNIPSGKDVINLRNDSTPELVAKPFILHKRDGGHFDLQILTESLDDLAPYIPHIAAQLGCTKEELLQQLTAATATYTERRPEAVHHSICLGGPLAVRSAAKSALVLWATVVGNEEVRSPPYEDVRRFIVNGDEAFNLARTHLDSRYLPHSEELRQRFGKFFNLIYVKSDDAGRVVAHFTLYNLISWQIVIAESGARADVRTGLISNPLDPANWSDAIADEVDIDFAWLDNPDYADKFVRARERFDAAGQHYVATQRPRELNRIAEDVFKKNGILSMDQPLTDAVLLNKIVWEISRRFASHALNLPHVENITGHEIAARLRELGNKSE